MSTINLTTSTKATIRAKVAEELKYYVCMLDNGSGYWSHEWNEDGSRKDSQTATGGGLIAITITFS